jgi:GTPase SAR1 family protein
MIRGHALSPESGQHERIKNLVLERLKAWTGATLQEYPSSGHELDIYAMTSDSISLCVEIIWSDSIANFYRDLNMIQSSDAYVKLVIASPGIMSKAKCQREFEKVVLAQRKQGCSIHGDFIDGRKILEDPEFMETEFRKIVADMLDHARKRRKHTVKEIESRLSGSVQIDYDPLLRICANQAKRNSAMFKGDAKNLYKKFIPELYVARHGAESIFDSFVESSKVFERELENYKIACVEYEKQLIEYRKKKADYDKKAQKAQSEGENFTGEKPRRPMEPVKPKAYHCIAYIGEAGIGKTNFLIDLCDRLQDKDVPTLFYAGHTLTENVDNQLVSDLLLATKSEADTSSFLESLNKTLRSHDGFLILLLDAINESKNYSNIGKQIVNFIDKLENLSITRIKLVISCRDIEWSTIAFETSSLNEQVFQKVPFHIEKLNKDELRKIWEKYREAYDLKTADFESLSPKIINIIDQPLMLRFLCEAYREDYLPRDIERLDIFEKYWDRKLSQMEKIGFELGIKNLKSKANDFIFEVVRKMRELKQWELSEYEAGELTGEKAENYESIFTRLLSEHIIIYSRDDVRIRAHFIGFTYEAFFEYVLAQLIYLQSNWGRLSEDEILSQFRVLVQESYEYRPMKGALEYLILSFSRDEGSKLYLRMLDELIKTEQSCEIAYEVISRLRVINVGVFRSLKQIIVATTGPRTIYRSWGQDHVATELLSNIPDSCLGEVFDEWRNWVSETYNMLQANTYVVGFAELAKDRPEKALKILSIIFSDERFRWCRPALTSVFLRMNSYINEDTVRVLLSMISDSSRFLKEIPIQYIRGLSEKLKDELLKYIPRFCEPKDPKIQESLLEIVADVGKDRKDIILTILDKMKDNLTAPSASRKMIELVRILRNNGGSQ